MTKQLLSLASIDQEPHNAEQDLHLLIRWRCIDAACHNEFIEKVGRRFRILAVYLCEWSREHWESNLTRLYGGRSMAGTAKLRQVGFTPFLAVIVADDAPLYGPCESLGGEVEVANRNIIAFKAGMRTEAGGNVYHSTSSRSEFLLQSSLLLGLEEAVRIESLRRWDGEVSKLNQDIEGAEGWECFEKLVAYLNRTCRWLVLRNFETLPSGLLKEKDLDVLTDDMEKFSAVAGLARGTGGLGHHTALIQGELINIDVRCLGDGYYPTLWESDLLATRIQNDNQIPRPEPVNYFFSLLYHARLHKSTISEHYVAVLTDLARKIRFYEVTETTLRDDLRSASILSGFMRRRLYPVSSPLDGGIFWNRRFHRLLSGFELGSPRVLRKRRLLRLLRQWLPGWSYRIAPRRLKAVVKSRLNH